MLKNYHLAQMEEAYKDIGKIVHEINGNDHTKEQILLCCVTDDVVL